MRIWCAGPTINLSRDKAPSDRWAEDPLLCPDCGAQMRILSFITEAPVVDRILRQVGWRPGQPAPDLIRAPPPVPKVAESPS